MANWTADRRIYLSEDGRTVDEAEPGRKRLVCAAGQQLTEAECRRYGVGPFDASAAGPADESAHYVLAGGRVHAPACDLAVVDTAGGRISAEDGLEYAAGLGFEPCPQCLSQAEKAPSPQASPVGGEGDPAVHLGRPHSWRKDGTCRCGAVKPEAEDDTPSPRPSPVEGEGAAGEPAKEDEGE